jgi:hypothetical protein
VALYRRCSTLPGGLAAALALAAALVIDTRLAPPAPPRGLVAGMVLLPSALLAETYLRGFGAEWTRPTTAQWVLAVLVLAAVAGIKVPAPHSSDDAGETLILQRLVRGTWLGVLAGLATLGWIGGPAIPGLVGLWAAVIAVSARRRLCLRHRRSLWTTDRPRSRPRNPG